MSGVEWATSFLMLLILSSDLIAIAFGSSKADRGFKYDQCIIVCLGV
jgi:hypothetical protein